MGWKKKERELTPEEAIQQAKTDAAPYWVDSSPLLVSVETNQGWTIYPLEQKYLKSHWILAFIDLTDPDGEQFLFFLREWRNRYEEFNLHFLLVFRPDAPYLLQKNFISALTARLNFKVPVVLDVGDKILKGYGFEKNSILLLITDKRKVAVCESVSDVKNFEMKIQNFLRETDKGLPFPPIFHPRKDYIQTSRKFDFSNGKAVIEQLPETLTHAELREKIRPNTFYTMGKWERDEEKLFTNDPKARMFFLAKDPEIWLMASSLTKLIEHGKIILEIEENAAFQSFVGEDMEFDDSGHSFISVKEHRIYKVLSKIPADKSFVELKFTTANRIPIGIYSLRFGKPLEF